MWLFSSFVILRIKFQKFKLILYLLVIVHPSFSCWTYRLDAFLQWVTAVNIICSELKFFLFLFVLVFLSVFLFCFYSDCLLWHIIVYVFFVSVTFTFIEKRTKFKSKSLLFLSLWECPSSTSEHDRSPSECILGEGLGGLWMPFLFWMHLLFFIVSC